MRRSDLEDFERQYLWHLPEDEDTLIRKLAWEYHYRTEDYDQTVCTMRRGKIAMPMNFEQASQCVNNALEVRKELTKNLHREQIQKFDEAVKAISPLFEQEYEPSNKS